jgi:hypothetical protein
VFVTEVLGIADILLGKYLLLLGKDLLYYAGD